MKKIVIKRIQEDKTLMQAVFLPEQGMNLSSLKFGDVEYIDQSTKPLFLEKFGGLGPLIGPHFYHRKNPVPLEHPEYFPHTAKIYPLGLNEPFSHGIGRYVAWNYSYSDLTLEGHLSGMDAHKGVSLASLEGFDFQMDFKAHATSTGLEIDYKVSSETSPTIAGLHYYLALENNSGIVHMNVSNTYNDMGTTKPIPKRWLDQERQLAFPLSEESDYTFLPNKADFSGMALLKSNQRQLKIEYQTASQENAFQLYHPKGASFVCIEPLTAKNPRNAQQKNNHLKVRIQSL